MPDEHKQGQEPDGPESRRKLPVQFPQEPPPPKLELMQPETDLPYTLQLCEAVLTHYVADMVRKAFGAKAADGIKVSMAFESTYEDDGFGEGKKEKGITYQTLDDRIDCEIQVEIDDDIFDLSHLRAESRDYSDIMEELGFEVVEVKESETDNPAFGKTARSVRAMAEKLGINVRDLMSALQEIDSVGVENYQGRVLNQNLGHPKR